MERESHVADEKERDVRFRAKAKNPEQLVEERKSGGLGMRLMKTLMDEVHYEVIPGQKHELRMIKRLKKQGVAALGPLGFLLARKCRIHYSLDFLIQPVSIQRVVQNPTLVVGQNGAKTDMLGLLCEPSLRSS